MTTARGDPNPGFVDPISVTGAELAALLTHIDAVVATFGSDGTILFINNAVRTQLGYEPSAMIGRNVAEFMHPDDLGVLADRWATFVGRDGATQEPDYRIKHADGSWVPVTIESVSGPSVAAFGAGTATMRLVEQTSRVERELRERLVNEDRLVRLATTFVRLPFERFSEGVDAALAQLGGLKDVDRASVFRRKGDTLVRTNHWFSTPAAESDDPGAMPIADSPYLQALADLKEVYIEDMMDIDDEIPGARQIKERGSQTLLAVPMIEQGQFAGFLSFSSRRGSMLKEASYLAMIRAAAGLLGEAFARHDAERRLAFQAHSDSVTGLGNRWFFMDALSEALARVKAGSLRGVGVLLLDLDRFKVVNDSLGHAAGDQLLAQVASRLGAAVSATERLARFGGDEIIVLLEGVDGLAAATKRARELCALLAAPFEVGVHEVFVTTSGGLVLADDAELEPDELLRRADAAMYRAKELGRDRIAAFDDTMREDVSERLRRESELRRAVRDEQFVLYYQPEIDLESGQVLGVEALLRWNHPERGVLAAGEFIDIAEETGAILEMGQWVFVEASRQLARWQDAGLHLTMRVNLSARQVGQPDLVPRLVDAIRTAGVEPAALCLEITETAIMADAELSLEVLEKLHSLGLQLAIDDFGTGYSSLEYLKRFPVDVLKIDRSFVAGLGHDPDDTAIVRAILSLADALGLIVTAEGVETNEQLAELRKLQCARAQGFLLGRPAPPERIEQLFSLRPQ